MESNVTSDDQLSAYRLAYAMVFFYIVVPIVFLLFQIIHVILFMTTVEHGRRNVELE
ncbi:hypothetical protein DPMN_047722 [Dreissena polymorpha]|uniref:Uncharacterized protein n=1 Tax=Dreissena polymorpha TaxID=45954 RepID=A0A9D4DA95_DREPO|nr:hypothetical protein DPMN_047722 [Dreissena polymorpha]